MGVQGQFPDEASEAGEFVRQEDAFRHLISDGPEPGRFIPAAGRYHLYVSLACPWASRTLIVRNLKGLPETVGVTVVDPIRDERGWRFGDGRGFSRDPVNDFHYLAEAYQASMRGYHGRVTVPVLWDKELGEIVNNSEDDICRMFNDAFGEFARGEADLFPADLAGEQEELSQFIYERINNGVYKAGFATRQKVYEEACRELFEAVDRMDERLSQSRFLFGSRIVETDWRLFCTLIRFDAVYHGHFKCNLRRILDYPNLHGYMLDLYQQPGIAETVNMDHIKRHYYVTHDEINPTQIVPLGPAMDLQAAHGREKLA